MVLIGGKKTIKIHCTYWKFPTVMWWNRSTCILKPQIASTPARSNLQQHSATCVAHDNCTDCCPLSGFKHYGCRGFKGYNSLLTTNFLQRSLRILANWRFNIWMKFVENTLLHPKVKSTAFFLMFLAPKNQTLKANTSFRSTIMWSAVDCLL